MSDRDSLIALIEQAEGQLNNDKPSIEQIADHLISHGVGFFADIRAENKRLLEALELLESELNDPSDDSEVGLLNNLTFGTIVMTSSRIRQRLSADVYK